MNGIHPLARFTIHIDHDFGDRIKNAAHGLDLSIAQLLTAAVVDYVIVAEREHHNGQPFPPRPSLAERAITTHRAAQDATQGGKAGA